MRERSAAARCADKSVTDCAIVAGEEEGEVGSSAFAKDHPEVVKGLQGVFNQDNGTGRVVRMSAGGIPDADPHVRERLEDRRRDAQVSGALVMGNKRLGPRDGLSSDRIGHCRSTAKWCRAL